MTEEIKRQLWEWAAAYHCAGFIQNDPVQFPHRYERRQDIEISGLLTAIMSFGNRKQILKKADELHRLMGYRLINTYYLANGRKTSLLRTEAVLPNAFLC